MKAFKTLTAVSVLALVAVSNTAFAQNETTPQDPQSEASNQDIIVTGSRVARTGFETPNPVTVIGAAEIQARGQINIAETVATLPQNVSKVNDQNTGLASNIQALIGGNVVDLRGLNPSNGVRTLVLVNTKRFVPSTSGGAVDLNLIPSMLVKSLETVTGGASAAYGTDALAGVVNVLLDTKLTGIKTQLDYGQTTHNDGKTYHAAVAGGTGFAGGRGHIIFGAEWQKNEKVGDCTFTRAWCAKSYDTFLNEQYRVSAAAPGPGNGFPQYVRGENSVYTNYDLSTVIRGTTAGQRVNPTQTRNFVFSDNGKQLLEFDPGTFVQATGFGNRQGGDCLLECSIWSEVELRPKVDRLALYSHAEFEVSDKLKFSLEGSYGTRDSTIKSVSLGPSSGTPIYSDNAYLQGVTYFNRTTNSNQLLVGPYGADGQPVGGLIPSAATYCVGTATTNPCLGASQPGTFTTGVANRTLVPLYIAKHFRNVPGGRSEIFTNLKTWRVMAGLDGEIDALGGLKWDVYYQYGHTGQFVKTTGNRVNTFFAYAIDAVDEGAATTGVPNGRIVCRATLPGPANRNTPAGSEQLYNQANAAGCVPMNLLGNGTESAASIAYAFRDATEDFKYQQHVLAGNISGNLFEGWAGPIGVATGGEYRFEKGFAVHNKLPFNVVNTNSPFGNDYGGSLKILEGYFEGNVPLLKDMAVAKLLELNAAARYTNQTNTDAVTGGSKDRNFWTWKVSATWDVTDWFRLRGTRSRDVRAASFNDLYSNLPPVEPGPPAGTAFNRWNGGSQANGVANGGVNTFARVLSPSNFALKPEVGDTWTAGIVLQPHGFLDGLRVAVDYYDIKIRDVILNLTTQEIVDACYVANVLCNNITNAAGATFSSLTNNADKITFGNITRGANNIASFRQKGWDVEVFYALPLDRLKSSLPGALSFRGLATITDTMKVDLGNGAGALEYRNQTGGAAFGGFTAPAKYILTGYATYAVDGFSFTVDSKYVPKGIYDIRRKEVGSIDPATGQAVTNTTENSINDNSVASRIYFGLAGSYKFNMGTGDDDTAEVFFTVRNLFGVTPPNAASNVSGTLGLVRGSGGPTNPIFYDTLGTQWRMGLRVNF